MFLRPYSFQHKEKFSVSHGGIQKQQCGIQIPHCKTENIQKRSKECDGAN